MEYFCFEGNGLWNSTDSDLLNLAEREARHIGILGPARCVGGRVVRVPKAYPVYDNNYGSHLETIRQFLMAHLPNLQLVGRNGMHRYNNQDHAMLTRMLAAKNLSGGFYDLRAVNSDAQYLETLQEDRRVPHSADAAPGSADLFRKHS
jgi:protoporphyrinogen oxidase